MPSHGAKPSTEMPSIFIGANAIDFSGYPDCRKEYFDGWNRLIKVGMKNPAADATPAF